MASMIGQTLGHYRIEAKLGEGGMGVVYRAFDTHLDRPVAIKILRREATISPERKRRFVLEAKAASALNHANIIHIYDIDTADGTVFIAMEFVPGKTLDQCLGRNGLSLRDTLKYSIQVADALATAHAAGIVHRDLKPANIIVSDDGRVKLVDFGLAKLAERSEGDPDAATATMAAPDAPQTEEGTIVGTVAYMSPEQAEGKKIDARSDIFSFGSVLYEMVTGRRAFEGATKISTLSAILHIEPKPVSEVAPGVPAELEKMIARCLRKDLERRAQHMADVKLALDELKDDSESGKLAGARSSDRDEAMRGRPPLAAEPDWSALPSAARLWPWAAAALAMALAVTAAVGWWRASRSAPLNPLMRFRVELGPDIKLQGDGAALALSPDGTLLAAIVRGADSVSRLATRRLDQSEFTPLAGTDGASSPFFSPDGEWIGFNSDRKIKKISVRGGVAVTLCDAPGMITPSWGDDGNIIAALGWGTGLSRMPSSGGAPAPVTELNHEKGERRHGWPQVLPGSRAVLFSTQHATQTFDDADIEVVSLKTGKRTTVHHGGFFARYLPSGHLVWVHQNALYAAPFDLGRLALTGEPQPVVEDIHNGMDPGGDFGFSQTGTFVYVSGKGGLPRSIFWLDSTGRTRPLHPAPGIYGSPRFSPDGRRLAFSIGDGRGHEDIWVRDPERDTASRVTLLPGQNQWPVWTPDGNNLVFWSSNPAAPGIYWIRADGSGVAQRLTDGKDAQMPQSISPDGKWLAMAQASAGGGVEIWMAHLEGDAGHPRLGRMEPFLQRPFNTILPAFSPDGRWLAYCTSEPGKEGLWVVPFPGPGGGWLVSSRGSDPIWSRNGRELFFLGYSRTIMVAGYAASGDALVFGKPQVWSPHPLMNLGSPPIGAYDLAPDGKRFAVVLNADGTADPKPITHLTFLLNFFDDLRRRVPAGGK